MKRALRRLGVAAALWGAGCGGAVAPGAPAAGPPMAVGPAGPDEHAGHVMPGAMPEAEHQHGLVATAGPGYTVADVEFMQMMMGHHAQAVTMAGMAAPRGAGPEVLTLAERIDIAQRDEMAFMARWLDQRGQVVPTEADMSAMRMPGLVPPEGMARLAAARGTAFDRLFLTYMIEHHLGAIQMVDELFARPGSVQDSDLFPFVSDVGADQRDEIGIMERILGSLAPNR